MSRTVLKIQVIIALCLVWHSFSLQSRCKEVASWTKINALVIESALTESSITNGRRDASGVRIYPSIRYSYVISGVEYFGSCLVFGQLSISEVGGSWNKFIELYKKDSNITIYVCPEDHSKSSILCIVPKSNYYYMIFSILFLAFIASILFVLERKKLKYDSPASGCKL
jgi:hypothetical protein